MQRQAVYTLLLVGILTACDSDNPRRRPEDTVKVFQEALVNCNFELGWEMMTPELRFDEFDSSQRFQLWCMNQREAVKAVGRAVLKEMRQVDALEYRAILYYAPSHDYTVIVVVKNPETKLWSVKDFRSNLPRHMAF
ncbi:hypothetical protein JW905_13855 [bacterium]|nr:hypothetical protein [candidate division CSSED10-310 bacterium]